MLNLEALIEVVVKEVLKEIVRQGGDFILGAPGEGKNSTDDTVIDMTMYKTPLLTEKIIAEVKTSVVVVPKGTILTPGAREVIRKKKITINYLTK